MWNEVNAAGRAGRATRTVLIAGAMLISGCLHAGPSVKQAMTSAAPALPPVTAPAAQQAKAGFDLDKPEVRSKVAKFQNELRDFFDGALVRSGKYVPTMTDMLIRQGLPGELAYLPLIESGYRPQAVSPAGAVGPWQFIPETGRRYGLRIDSMVDERRDPIKSTEAAALYLKELHEMFGDWELSLAAYNSGEWRVARILANHDAPNFWAMRDRGYLPNETSEYVPRFLAAVQIAKAPQEYGFATPTHSLFHFETVDVDRQLPLRTAADMCGVSASELEELNPALRRGIMPSGYALRVPTGAAEPLRVALANYVEPVHSVRQIARATRPGSRGTAVARADRRGKVLARESTPFRTTRGSPARQKSLARDTPPARLERTARDADDRGRRRGAAIRVARETPPIIPAKPSKSGLRSRRRAS